MEAEVRAHDFQPRDLVGGDLVLNLVNTVTARNAEPIDWLDGYARLLDWAELCGTCPADDLAALRREAAAHPRAASRALARVKELREALWELLTAAGGAGASAGLLANGNRVHLAASGRRAHRDSRHSQGVGARLPHAHSRPARGTPPGGGAAEPAADLRRTAVRLVLPGHLEGRPAPLVRHGDLRQRRENPTPQRPSTWAGQWHINEWRLTEPSRASVSLGLDPMQAQLSTLLETGSGTNP